MIMDRLQLNMASMEMVTADAWRVGIYCRLSKDDDLQGESASIAHQREYLESYCQSQGWEVFDVYQDDGYTGLNMERPDLQRMLSDAKKGKINLILTKDASRLGRNYLETGRLMDYFFPKNSIRYIAVNDGIDTLYDNNDIAPFKNILNEMYSKDISKKVHSSYVVQARKGKFTGCLAPLGYMKDPADKYHLVVDEDTAWIVKALFDYAMEGKGSNYIRRRLEEGKVPCPTWWNRQKGLRNTYTHWEKEDPENGRFMWDFSVIETILQNPVYYGAIASQRKNYRFKVGVIGDKKPEAWIIVEDCHDPIIDKRTFMAVQEKIRKRQHPRGTKEYSLFSGLIKCKQCGKALTIRDSNTKNPIRMYSCVTYNRFGKQHCTQHRVEYDKLCEVTLDTIRKAAKAALKDQKKIIQRIASKDTQETDAVRERLQRNIAKATDRLEVLEKMIGRLYEDMISGKISESNFASLMKKTEDEQRALQVQITEDQERLSNAGCVTDDTKDWLAIISDYAGIEELDRTTLHHLVKQIVVDEQIDKDGNRDITIEIHFNFKNSPVFMGAGFTTCADRKKKAG